jgi:non-ribosomal peptide synthetase component E (peptide arylation enzyme)
LTDIAAHCRAAGLANQKIPEQLEFVDALPINSMGKVLKHELRAQFGSPA